MSWEDWSACDALGLAELARGNQVSVLEIAEQVEHAVYLVNPRIRAVLEFYYDKLTPQAAEALPKGIFYGCPFFFKDVGDVEKGRLAANGSRTQIGRVVDSDTPYIRKMRASGLNFLGRTAAPEFGNAPVTESLLNGTTHNPWDLRYSPGGSSGGAAAAVAAGILPMSASNDGGGSTRIPASMCGNVGLKYSRALVARIREIKHPYAFTSVGVNSRTVRDQAAFLDAVLEPDKTNSAPGTKGTFLHAVRTPNSSLRIALSAGQLGEYGAPSDAMAEMYRVASVLEDLGHRVEERDPRMDYAAFQAAFQVFWTAPSRSRVPPSEAKSIEPDGFATNPLVEPMTRKMYRDGQKWSWTDYEDAMSSSDAIAAGMSEFFQEWDCWLTPTIGQHTPQIGGPLALSNDDMSIDEWWYRTFAMIPFTPIANITGQPAISLPVARFDSGMPLGAHFMADHGRDAMLLRLGAELEEAMPWRSKSPPTHVTAL